MSQQLEELLRKVRQEQGKLDKPLIDKLTKLTKRILEEQELANREVPKPQADANK